MLIFIFCANISRDIHAATPQIPVAVAPEPVGSGARALGQSAFIAVVDDATAASWNPAGLINLEKPEISIVGAWKINSIDLTSTDQRLSYDENTWRLDEINFISCAQPLRIVNTNAVISFNYHQVYDLGLEFTQKWIEAGEVVQIDKSRSKGAISAYSLAAGFSIPNCPQLTVGASINWFTQSLLNPHVRRVKTTETEYDLLDIEQFISTETLDDLHGHNFTFGLLWDVYEKDEQLLTLGLVCHTPFTADAENTLVDPSLPGPDVTPLDIDFPRSIGAGVNYRFSDKHSMAFDVQRTNWSEYSYIPNQKFTTDDAIAYRLGFEHLDFPEDIEQAISALRYGAFYEPRPTWDDIIPIYGLSAGVGWTVKDKFSLDFAYQYHWGEEELKYFEYNADEHFFVASVIIYIDKK